MSNPLGGLFDQTITAERTGNLDWNTVWDVQTARFDQGWTIEMAIPFKSLRHGTEAGQYWGDQFSGSIRVSPTIFRGLSEFFVGDLMGKALWKLVENAQRFPRRGGRVLCVHGPSASTGLVRVRQNGPRGGGIANWTAGVLGLRSTRE